MERASTYTSQPLSLLWLLTRSRGHGRRLCCSAIDSASILGLKRQISSARLTVSFQTSLEQASIEESRRQPSESTGRAWIRVHVSRPHATHSPWLPFCCWFALDSTRSFWHSHGCHG